MSNVPGMAYSKEALNTQDSSSNKQVFKEDFSDVADQGSFPNSLSGLYQLNLVNPNPKIAEKIWTIEGTNWHEVFGYRFSVAFVDPGTSGVDINSLLSAKKESPSSFLGKAAEAIKDLPVVGGLGDALSAVDDLINNNVFNSSEKVAQFRHFTLPIPPQSLMVKPITPSRITPTMGGVVEEVSAVKLWSISMNGTTGTGVSQSGDALNSTIQTAANAFGFSNPLAGPKNRDQMAKKFREVLDVVGFYKQLDKATPNPGSGIGNADLNGLINNDLAIAGVTNASNSLSSGNILSAGQALSDGVVGSENNKYLPKFPFSSSAVDSISNGFVEAQELEKFFFMYHALKNRYPKNFALLFTSAKSDQVWRCAVKDFTLQRSADNPFLYRYQIALQCWDVRSAKELFSDSSLLTPFDRFGPGGDLFQVNMVSNKNISSKLKDFMGGVE